MWLSPKVFSILEVSKDAVDQLHLDLQLLQAEREALRVERDNLKVQLSISQNHFDWLRLRVNVLETERAQLVKLAFNIDSPVPEVVRKPDIPDFLNSALFEDLGDQKAKELGLDTYN